MSGDSYGAFQSATLLPFSESAQQQMAEWPLPFLPHPHLTGPWTKWRPTARQGQGLPAQQIVFGCLWVCVCVSVYSKMSPSVSELSPYGYCYHPQLMPFFSRVLHKGVSTTDPLLSSSRPSNGWILIILYGDSRIYKWNSYIAIWLCVCTGKQIYGNNCFQLYLETRGMSSFTHFLTVY